MKLRALSLLALCGLLPATLLHAQQRLSGVTVGQEAPDIAMAGPQGDTLRLSQLRGYVVLVDFWASWCRPCRMENPHVVATYKAYKDSLFTQAKGFRVFSVSLDRRGGGEAWKKAIAQDSLFWPWHVAAVESGVNTAANTYQVQFIPTNVLVGADGRVIGVDVHGEDLDHALAALLEHDPARQALLEKQRAKAARAAAKAGRKQQRAGRK